MIAIEPTGFEEIILYDGTKHGYNAMFCDEFTLEQRQNRPLTLFKDNLYKIKVQAFYGIDYQEEREDFEDEKGNVKLMSGEIIDFQTLEQDGMDALSIIISDKNNHAFTLIEEELA